MQRRGATLIELLLVCGLMAAIAAIALPRLQAPLDRLAVERAAHELASAHGRARFAAILRARPAGLVVTPDSLTIYLYSRVDTLVLWRGAGPAADGVALRGPVGPILYSPTGMAMGFANGTWVLTRGASRRQVITSRLGRLRLAP